MPMEVWSGKPWTDYKYLHIFGYLAYYHVRESKLDPRAKKTLFMGFSTGAAMVNQNKHEGETEATKTMSSSKQMELLKTPVVPVRPDVTYTSPTVDFNDDDKDHEDEASTQEPL
ncbi:unnamed protein product [Prunus armeniaca]|uniref:Uncharacterized protein n=1 Tax=Prunus armeniaca TaxID=36596 RepID=A0A6J5TR44_PRUAR|nr:unnamed protein product [Prunus armeniaca]